MAKRKAVKKRVEVETQYECDKCQDRKVIERNGKLQKCICVIQKEMDNYLDDLGDGIKYKKQATVLKFDKDILFTQSVTFLEFMSRAKQLLFNKFFQGAPTYDIVSVTDYTNSYVIGEHLETNYVEYLFLTMGRDNFNQSQHTTVFQLLNSRKEMDLVTWIYIYPNVTKSRLVDLYGLDAYNFIMDKSNYLRITK